MGWLERGIKRDARNVDTEGTLRRSATGLLLALALVAGAAPAAHANETSGAYIVVLEDGTDPSAAANEHGRRYGVQKRSVYRHALRGYSARIPESRVDDLRKDPDVAYVSADRPFTVAAQDTPTGVRRIRTLNTVNEGTNVNVAIIDTGVDVDHPDLAANVVGGAACSGESTYDDGNGHGTHVAGIVAAVDNSVGVRGVAPGAKLWSVRVLDSDGDGSDSSVLCGVDFVDARSPFNGGPITVANMSLEATGLDDGNCGNSNGDPLHQAVCRLVAHGVTVVAAAGNSGKNITHQQPGQLDIIPATYDEVITASALADSDGAPCGLGGATGFGADDTFASFSNYATGAPDRAHMVAAPGTGILSTYKNGTYAVSAGTSMAAPHVSGAAALYIAQHPGAIWSEVLGSLKATGEAAGVNFGGECTGASSHTDPSTRHPEVVVAILPQASSISPPVTLTGPATVGFADDVTGVDGTNIVMRLTSGGGNLPATVSYNSGTHTATLQPSSPLLAGERYTVFVAPSGSTPILDDGTPVASSSLAFRASRMEQEQSVGAKYLWRTVVTSGAHGGQQITNRTQGAWVTYTFTGTSVSWYSMRGRDQGRALVQIDGVDRGVFDNYRSSVEYRYRRSWGLSSGTHTIRIIVQSKGPNATDGYVTVDAFGVGSTINVNPILRLAWRSQASSVASGGRITQERSPGANVYFHFRGTGVDWGTILGPDHGMARVYVDGLYRGLFDNYATSARAFIRQFRGFVDGVHFVRIIVTGTKRSASTSTTVSVDFWRVA